MDESWIGGLALHRSEHWDGGLWISRYQLPPAHFWAQALLFRFMGVSLESLWLLPAILSVAGLALGYWAARKNFPAPFAGICLLASVADYWLLWGGRLSVGTADGVFPWECLVLGTLGLTLGKWKKGKSGIWPLLLGAATGLGPYVAIVCAFLALVVGATVLRAGWGEGKNRWKLWGPFAVGLLTLAPLLYAGFRQGWGNYPSSLWFAHGSPLYANHWEAPLSHLTALFWGAKDWTFWGGLLNPVASSLCFLGVLVAWKGRRSGLPQWFLWALAVFGLPGLLTNNFEPFREVLLLPLLIVLQVLGLSWLLSEVPQTRVRLAGATLLLSVGALLNLYHLWGPYREAWGVPGPLSSRFKPVESWRAYHLLRDMAEREGRGFIFTDFSLEPDPALRIACQPLNAIDTPPVLSHPVRWCALLANAPWVPGLIPMLPESQWYWLSENLRTEQGGLELGFVKLDGERPRFLAGWIKAQDDLREAGWILLEAKRTDPAGEAVSYLERHSPDFQGDPFLESVYWNKVQDLRAKRGDLPGALEALRRGIQEGFPNAFSYQKMGAILEWEGKTAEAQEAFRKARGMVSAAIHREAASNGK